MHVAECLKSHRWIDWHEPLPGSDVGVAIAGFVPVGTLCIFCRNHRLVARRWSPPLLKKMIFVVGWEVDPKGALLYRARLPSAQQYKLFESIIVRRAVATVVAVALPQKLALLPERQAVSSGTEDHWLIY